MATLWKRGKFSVVMMLFQIVFVVLFAVMVKYDPSADAKKQDKVGGASAHRRRRAVNQTEIEEEGVESWSTENNDLLRLYPSKCYPSFFI